MKNLNKFMRELAFIAKGMGVLFAAKYAAIAFRNLRVILRTKSLGVVDAGITGPLVVRVQGRKLNLASDTMPLVRELLLKNCYGFDATRRYGVVMDLGANRGVFSVLAAPSSQRVVAVECDAAVMPEKLARTMRENGVGNVTLVTGFVSGADSEGRLSINAILSAQGIRKIDFLKMDVEGEEADIFARNTEWLDVTSSIAMEVHPCFGVDDALIARVLERKGFRVAMFDKDLRCVTEIPRSSMGYIRATR